MELHKTRHWYSVQVDDRGELCCSMWEAASPAEAAALLRKSWGRDYKVVGVTQIANFYQEVDALTSEEMATLNAERSARLIAANSKTIVTPNGVFPSVKLAAQAIGLTSSQLRYKMKEYPTEYYRQ